MIEQGHTTPLAARMPVAWRLTLGALVGLTPLALVALGLGALFIELPFTGFVAWFSWAASLGLILVETLALLPMLLYSRTRAFAVGLTAGFVLTCAALALAFSRADLSGFWY